MAVLEEYRVCPAVRLQKTSLQGRKCLRETLWQEWSQALSDAEAHGVPAAQ